MYLVSIALHTFFQDTKYFVEYEARMFLTLTFGILFLKISEFYLKKNTF